MLVTPHCNYSEMPVNPKLQRRSNLETLGDGHTDAAKLAGDGRLGSVVAVGVGVDRDL